MADQDVRQQEADDVSWKQEADETAATWKKAAASLTIAAEDLKKIAEDMKKAADTLATAAITDDMETAADGLLEAASVYQRVDAPWKQLFSILDDFEGTQESMQRVYVGLRLHLLTRQLHGQVSKLRSLGQDDLRHAEETDKLHRLQRDLAAFRENPPKKPFLE